MSGLADVLDRVQLDAVLRLLAPHLPTEPSAMVVRPQAQPAEGRDRAGRLMVPLFELVNGEPVMLPPHEQRMALARAIASVRDSDGAPILYRTVMGVAYVMAFDGDAPQIVLCEDVPTLRVIVDRHITAGTLKKGEEVWTNDSRLVEKRLGELTRLVSWTQDVQLPMITGVRSFPFFDADGQLVNSRGYHARSQVYLSRKTEIAEGVDMREAIAILDDWMIDFYTHSMAHGMEAMAHILGFGLSILCRDMISGPTPGFMFQAAQHGTGKGLLVDSVALAITGHPAKNFAISEEPSRAESEVLTLLLSGSEVVVIDNVRGKLGGQALERLLTATEFTGRRLGTNEDVTIKVRSLFAITANNPELTPDMARRIVSIVMRSKEEKASARGGWRHPKIAEYTLEKRPRILAAFICLVRHWLERRATFTFRGWSPGSFESWANVVGGIVESAGMPGWGVGVAEAMDAADPRSAAYRAWAALMAREVCRHGRSVIGVRMLGSSVAHLFNQVVYFAAFFPDNDAKRTKQAMNFAREVTGRTWSLPKDEWTGEGGAKLAVPAGNLTVVSVEQVSVVFNFEVTA